MRDPQSKRLQDSKTLEQIKIRCTFELTDHSLVGQPKEQDETSRYEFRVKKI